MTLNQYEKLNKRKLLIGNMYSKNKKLKKIDFNELHEPDMSCQHKREASRGSNKHISIHKMNIVHSYAYSCIYE